MHAETGTIPIDDARFFGSRSGKSRVLRRIYGVENLNFRVIRGS